jgi:hypothetical protein
MEVNKQLYQLLLNECCVGLNFDSVLKQYSFAFRHVPPAFFYRLAAQAKVLGVVMREADLNFFLQQVSKAATLYESVRCHWQLTDCNVMVGEVLRLYGSHTEHVDVVKMYAGEYLISYSDYSLARPFLKVSRSQSLDAGTDLYTDDGRLLFKLTNVEILRPTIFHSALDQYYLPHLADSLVTENLWHAYNELSSLLLGHRTLTCEQQQIVYSISSRNGISIFTLLYLITAIFRSL